MISKKRHYVIAYALVIFLVCAQASANLLTNGSFETPPPSGQGNQGFFTQSIPNASTTFTINGWTFGRLPGNNAGTPRFHWFSTDDRPFWANAPLDGNYAIQLNSDNANSRVFVEQTVAVTAGLEYELSFNYIDESFFANADIGVTAAISGSALASDISTDFTSSLNDVWVNGTIRFTAASSGDITIRFTDLIPSNNVQQNVTLDDISLVVVPEAETVIALLVLVLIFVGRHFRKSRLKVTDLST